MINMKHILNGRYGSFASYLPRVWSFNLKTQKRIGIEPVYRNDFKRVKNKFMIYLRISRIKKILNML